MKNRSEMQRAVLLSVLFGVLMYPTVLWGIKLPDLGILAWIHLVPLLLVLEKCSFKDQFVCTFVTILLSLIGNLYWLYVAMRHYGGLNAVEASLVLLFLLAVLAAFKTVFVCSALQVQKYGRLSLALTLPVFLTVHDYAIHQIPFGGFPWVIPAYSQGQWMMFLQWVSVSGAFGVCLFIYLINALIVEGCWYFSLSRGIDKSIARFFLVFVLGLISLYMSFLSSQSFDKNQVRKGEIKLGLIQANISQDQKWSRENLRSNLRLHQDLTFSAIRDGAELVLWPESAYPYRLDQDDLLQDHFLDYDELAAELFVGAVLGEGDGSNQKLFNAVVHVDRQARFTEQYHKMHLVPFGEYVPMGRYLKFVDAMTQQVGDFQAGQVPALFHVKDIAFGSLICYEDVFLDIAQKFSLAGADVLVNYTNDAWYENTSAQHQHLVMSQFRALENRKPLVRATNTGMTAVINARGFIIDDLDPFETRYLVHNLQVVSQNSFFSHFGTAWILLLEIVAVLMLAYAYARHKLRSHKILVPKP